MVIARILYLNFFAVFYLIDVISCFFLLFLWLDKDWLQIYFLVLFFITKEKKIKH